MESWNRIWVIKLIEITPSFLHRHLGETEHEFAQVIAGGSSSSVDELIIVLLLYPSRNGLYDPKDILSIRHVPENPNAQETLTLYHHPALSLYCF